MEIFSQFPKVKYNGIDLLDLLASATIIRDMLQRYSIYFPYTVIEGERPDTIAYDYYGSSSYTWLVLIVNDIHDMYYQWPLTTRQFEDYILTKYGNNTTIKSLISHYHYTGIGENENDILRKSYTMSTDTFSLMSAEEKSGWSPVTTYDYEYELNEQKRYITLLSNQYLKQIDREVKSLFNG